MDARKELESKRNRTIAGAVVVLVSLVVAVSLAGLSFAAGGGTASKLTPAKFQYGGKLTICHHTKSLKNPVVTITIPASAWAAHQKHGDTLGPCTAKQIKHAKAVAHAKLVKLAKAKAKGHKTVVVKAKKVVVVNNGKAKGHSKK